MTKDSNRHFTEDAVWVTSKHMKMFLTSFIIRKMQIKSTINTTTEPPEWLKIKHWADSVKDAEKLNLSYVSDGNVKWYHHLGKVSFSC
jgi:hypothetical protein